MTPIEYEAGIAEHFRLQGYTVCCTSASNDYGVDVFAEKGAERLAIQAKMYGETSRLVNRDMVMHLHGAKDFFDCTGAVFVTDGTLMDDAAAVARKLRIEILSLQPDQLPAPAATAVTPATDKVVFDAIWREDVMPLVGLQMTNSKGGTNTLVQVDWAGVERVTSNGKSGFIPIEPFRWAIGELLAHGLVTRDHINQMYSDRAASGVCLILSQVPLFEQVSRPLALKLRSTAQERLAKHGIKWPAVPSESSAPLPAAHLGLHRADGVAR